jgi:hypothetical protein
MSERSVSTVPSEKLQLPADMLFSMTLQTDPIETRNNASYAQCLEVLTALVSYLALSDVLFTTIPFVADYLGLKPNAVQNALESFTGFFRKSRHQVDGEHSYALTVRFALAQRKVSGEDMERLEPALRADLLKVLLDTIGQRAQAEQSAAEFKGTLETGARSMRTTLIVAIIAAMGAISAAIISLAK